ncbi:fumarylacetoacetate hydrolase family protein [Rhodoferax sp. UBA5149]|uniref:fumarylacetoacetate hydrolase family protein n=1 Tax=Rhodoferax sp. UBA5149 TaxID=1947379 RepID=UPI0025F1CB92|nr:fumarylacetoacetate hydrolase family protein [Rhodoferax sp. UBA5149]
MPLSASSPSPAAPLSATPPAGRFIPFDLATGATYALGLTYADHIRETGERPGRPVVFQKHCAATPGEGARVATPTPQALCDLLLALDPALAAWLSPRLGAIPPLLDYEGEIGVVLFDPVTEAALATGAPLPRLGFFLANDLTARSIQIAGEGTANRLDFWSSAKSLPGFLPVGPRVWCPDGVGPEALPQVVLRTHVNGTLRQSASTGTVLYTLRQMLQVAAVVAPGRCLRAHDLVLTGTPAGIALSVPRWKRRLALLLARRQRIRAAVRSAAANPRFLQPGDTVRVSADWLGSCECTIAGAA